MGPTSVPIPRSYHLATLVLHLRRLLLALAAVLPARRRLFSFVALKDLHLSLSFLLSGLSPASLHLPTAGGATHLRLWAPTRPGSRPPLLLIHGFGGNARWQFEKQVPPLARSFDLYVPDLVFFGESSTAGPDRSVEFQARCLIDAMARLGVAKYAVAGISYGGFVAYRMAEIAGAATVERVVVMTAGVCTGAAERRELVEREGRDVSDVLLPRTPDDLMELIRRSMYRAPRWVPEFFLRDFIELMYKDMRKERVEMLRDLVAKGVGVDPLPVLKQETLILWGDQDTVFPISLAYKLQRHLGAKARLEVIKDAGHALQLEKADIVNHLIEWFVSEPSQSKSE